MRKKKKDDLTGVAHQHPGRMRTAVIRKSWNTFPLQLTSNDGKRFSTIEWH